MYNEGADVFSYGMVLAELITLEKPGTHFWIREAVDCYDLDPQEFVNKVPAGCPPAFVKIVLDCVAYDMDNRPSFDQLMAACEAAIVEEKVRGSTAAAAAAATMKATPSGLRDSGRRVTMGLRNSQPALPDLAQLDRPSTARSPLLRDSRSTLNRKSVHVLLLHLVKMVERSTNESYHDSEYVLDFLLAYRQFTNPQKLLEILLDRFIQGPAEVGKNPQEEKKIVQIKVLVFLKTWMTRYSGDFEAPDMAERLDKFQQEIFNQRQTFKIRAVLEKQQAQRAQQLRRVSITAASESNLALMGIASATIARHLSLFYWTVCDLVIPREFLDNGWKTTDAEISPNLKNWAKANELLSLWVAWEIVKLTEDIKGRVQAIERWVEIAEACRQLNNFECVAAVLKGLASPNVSRLTATFAEVPQAVRQRLATLRDIVKPDDEFRNYRAQLAQAAAPIIPILDVFLEEVSYVDVSQPNTLNGEIINFSKYRAMGRLMRKLEVQLQTKYPFPEEEPIAKFIHACLTTVDEPAVKEKSYLCQAPNFFVG